MADITNPAAVKFSNERIRIAADELHRAYRICQALADDWTALGMSALIKNTVDPIIDGSASDGRTPITGAAATAIVTRAIEFVADMQALGNAKLNTVIAVKVNG